jgi:hypothetical protein
MDYKDLTYDRFKELAKDKNLSTHEKVGFPDEYRDGSEEIILKDILSKCQSLSSRGGITLEIGPGCSNLPVMLEKWGDQYEKTTIFIDSQEMLEELKCSESAVKVPGIFPDMPDFINEYRGLINSIIVYSVIQYPFVEGSIYKFIDACMMLLCDGGEVLLGDIPNLTMRKRFFASENGIRHHRKFTGSETVTPTVEFNKIEPEEIDDAIALSIIARCRMSGYHAWILPQGMDLPMANRREDILIRKP